MLTKIPGSPIAARPKQSSPVLPPTMCGRPRREPSSLRPRPMAIAGVVHIDDARAMPWRLMSLRQRGGGGGGGAGAYGASALRERRLLALLRRWALALGAVTIVLVAV